MNGRHALLWLVPSIIAAAGLLEGCSRTGMCEYGECVECASDDECILGRCLDGRCIGPDEANLLPLLVVEPNPLDFGRVPRGTVATGVVHVHNVGEGWVEFEDIFLLNDPHFELTSEFPSGSYPPGSVVDLEITFSPEEEGLHQAQMLIRSDNAEGDVFVDLIANGTVPCLEVSADESGVDFGRRRWDRGPYIEPVQVRNCASEEFGEPLDVYGIELLRDAEFMSSPDFSLVALPDFPVTLLPQESFGYEVYYDPGELGPDEGLMRITSNDEPRDPLDIDVRGEGSDNDCPVARAVCWQESPRGPSGADVHVEPYVYVACSATESTDADGTIVGYTWEVIERPSGSTSVLEPSANAPEIRFLADLAGRYTLRLDLEDDDGAEACHPADVIVTATPDEDIHIQIVWDRNDTDVDMHLLHPRGDWNGAPYDCYFANMNPNWGDRSRSDDDPSLDVDDVDGYGPENINLDNPENVTYSYGNYYFSDHGRGSTRVTTRIFLGGVLALELLDRRMDNHEFWDVARIDWSTRTVRPVDSIGRGFP